MRADCLLIMLYLHVQITRRCKWTTYRFSSKADHSVAFVTESRRSVFCGFDPFNWLISNDNWINSKFANLNARREPI